MFLVKLVALYCVGCLPSFMSSRRRAILYSYSVRVACVGLSFDTGVIFLHYFVFFVRSLTSTFGIVFAVVVFCFFGRECGEANHGSIRWSVSVCRLTTAATYRQTALSFIHKEFFHHHPPLVHLWLGRDDAWMMVFAAFSPNFRIKKRERNEYTSEAHRISSLRPFSSCSCIPSIGELPVSLYSQNQEPPPPTFSTFTFPLSLAIHCFIASTSFSGLLLCGSRQRHAAQRSTMLSLFPPNVRYL